jgi:hypothetical protein
MKMFSVECITQNQKQSVESAATAAERNRRLLKMVRRGSETDFCRFIECLNRTEQHHVSSLLSKNAVVAQIVAIFKQTAKLKQHETDAVQRLQEIFKKLSKNPDQILTEEQCAIVGSWYTETFLKHDVGLLDAKTGNSVTLFFYCTSMSGLQYLHELFSSRQLEAIIENLFNTLLEAEQNAALQIDELKWEMRDYLRCMQHMCSLSQLPELSMIYELAQKQQEPLHNTVPCSTAERDYLALMQLPYELTEEILVKALLKLFVKFNKTTPRAKVYAALTICAVSQLWWETCTNRKYLKRKVKGHFKQICRPFRCSPRQLSNISVQGDRAVWGVAEFKGKLYVACEESDTIQVYEGTLPFARLDDIKIQGLHFPKDMTVCREKGKLYVADWKKHTIWLVKLDSYKQQTSFGIPWQPRSLSVNFSRLLITPFDGSKLFLYDDEGTQLKSIELHDVVARHAVETSRNTYIISYRRLKDQEYTSVAEVNDKGKIIAELHEQSRGRQRRSFQNGSILGA